MLFTFEGSRGPSWSSESRGYKMNITDDQISGRCRLPTPLSPRSISPTIIHTSYDITKRSSGCHEDIHLGEKCREHNNISRDGCAHGVKKKANGQRNREPYRCSKTGVVKIEGSHVLHHHDNVTTQSPKATQSHMPKLSLSLKSKRAMSGTMDETSQSLMKSRDKHIAEEKFVRNHSDGIDIFFDSDDNDNDWFECKKEVKTSIRSGKSLRRSGPLLLVNKKQKQVVIDNFIKTG